MRAGTTRGREDPVRKEFRESEDARWIERPRTLPPAALRAIRRRVAAGVRFGVAARIEDSKGRVMLVRMDHRTHWSPNWMTPGGGGEPGESPREAMVRKIREETGGRVRSLRLWKVFHETLQMRGDEGLAWDFLQYTAFWTGGRPHSLVPHHAVEARWFARLPKSTEFRQDWLHPPRSRFDRVRTKQSREDTPPIPQARPRAERRSGR